jgi:hypothetical protein
MADFAILFERGVRQLAAGIISIFWQIQPKMVN